MCSPPTHPDSVANRRSWIASPRSTAQVTGIRFEQFQPKDARLSLRLYLVGESPWLALNPPVYFG